MTIGRNDLCYCGSGKKYKKCHWLSDSNTKTNAKRIEFSEKEVLSNVLKDAIFKKYYDEFRPQIFQSIKWVKDFSLPQGINFRRTVTPGNEQIIRLKIIPARKIDSIKIAHEIHHIVIDNRNYPSVGFKDVKYENLASSLSSMLHDLLIEEFQLNYGFDVISDFEKEVKENKKQLKKEKEAPHEHFEKCKWIFNYCGSLLSWNILSPNKSEKHSFHSWFDNRFKNISKEAYDLKTIIAHNYKTQEGMKTIFTKIIDMYKLNKIIFLTQ